MTLLATLLIARAACAMDVTECGQSVPAGTTATLRADLDCSGSVGECVYPTPGGTIPACRVDADCVHDPRCAAIAVELQPGARLRLDGHTITGGGVVCRGTDLCTVRGPGVIAAANVGVLGRSPLRIVDLTVERCDVGIVGLGGEMRLRRVRVTESQGDGIVSFDAPVRGSRVTANDNGGGGLTAVRGEVRARRVETLRNRGNGVNGSPAWVSRLVSQDNLGIGLASSDSPTPLRASGSLLTGNGLPAGGVDLQTDVAPLLRRTTCDRSFNSGEGGSWNVCRFDGVPATSTTSTSVTTTTSTSTTTMTTIPCGSSAPICGGRCPSGGTCGPDAGGCACTFPAPPLRDVAAAAGRLAGAAVQSPLLLSDPIYAATVAREYALLSTEFELFWPNLHPAPGVYDFRGADAIVDFAEAHGMAVQGTPIVWYLYLPSYLSLLTPAQLSAELESHVRTVVGRYRGRVASWVIVNEVVSDFFPGYRSPSLFYDTLGPGYIEQVFRWAHDEDPDARLFINDYNVEGLSAKSDFLYGVVQGLVAAGAPIHGVGLQAHLGGVFGPLPVGVQANIQRFVDLGLAVNITEMDVQTSGLGPDLPSRLTAQRTIYHDIVAACVAVPGCDTVTTWGFTDRSTWILDFLGIPDQYPLPFDADYAPKPAYFGMADAFAGR